MTIPSESRFVLSECARCADLILSGRCGGLLWRVDRYTVPSAAADVLYHHGVPILAVQRRMSGLWGTDWAPADTPSAGRLLVIPHVCGSAHARGLPIRRDRATTSAKS